MPVLERFLAVLVVVVLVGCSSVPVGAASSCAGCADELDELIQDRAVLVQGTDGRRYAVLTNATHPAEWYSKGWVKPYDTVMVVPCRNLNPFCRNLDPKGLLMVYIKPPVSLGLPQPDDPYVVPAIGAAVFLGYTTVTGTEIVVLSSGAFIVGGGALRYPDQFHMVCRDIAATRRFGHHSYVGHTNRTARCMPIPGPVPGSRPTGSPE